MAATTKYGMGFIEFTSDGNVGTISAPHANSYGHISCSSNSILTFKGNSSANVQLQGIASGTTDDAVVTKAQMDTALLTGHKTRASVYAASTAAMPTTGVTVDLSAGTITVANTQTPDSLLGTSEGLTVADINDRAYQEGTRYLFYHGLTAGDNKLNGIYTLTTVTSTTDFVLTRAHDFNVGEHYQPNTTVYVEAGTANAGNTFGTSAIFDRYLEDSLGAVRVTTGSHSAGDTIITVDGNESIVTPTSGNVYVASPLSVHVGQAVQIKNHWHRVVTAPNNTAKTFVVTPALRETVEAGYPIRLGHSLVGDDSSDTANRIESASNTWTQVYGGAGGSFDTAGDGISNPSGTTIALDINGIAATISGASLAQADLIPVYDDGTGLSKVTFSNFEDTIFGNVSGDATIAAGGALTIGAGVVSNSMLANQAISGVNLGSTLNGLKLGETLSVSGSTSYYGINMDTNISGGDLVNANDVFFFTSDVSTISGYQVASNIGTSTEIVSSSMSGLGDDTVYYIVVIHNDATNGDSIDFAGTATWRNTGTKFDTLEGTNHTLSGTATDFYIFVFSNGSTTVRTGASVNLALDGNITDQTSIATGTMTGGGSIVTTSGSEDVVLGVQLYNTGSPGPVIRVSSLLSQYTGAEATTIDLNYNTTTFEIDTTDTFNI